MVCIDTALQFALLIGKHPGGPALAVGVVEGQQVGRVVKRDGARSCPSKRRSLTVYAVCLSFRENGVCAFVFVRESEEEEAAECSV